MAIIASDVMDRAANLLNDPSKTLYTYAIQLPFLTQSNEDLEKKLVINEIPVNNRTAATLTIAAGVLTYSPLPNDFIRPDKLWERASGSADEWVPIKRIQDKPGTVVQGNDLGVWWWDNQTISFLGSIAPRDVRLDYTRMILTISGNNSPEEVIGCMGYLAFRTAHYLAAIVGQSPVLADYYKGQSEEQLDDLLRLNVKGNQGTRSRRKSFRVTLRSPIVLR